MGIYSGNKFEVEARDGQKKAITKIIQRVTGGHSHTAIILPTRYGKSDVIRLTALELYEAGIIGAALVFSPNVFLRDQIVSGKKIKKMAELYGLTVQMRVSHPSNPSVNYLKDSKAHLISLTTQILNSRRIVFEEWIDHIKHKTGKPVLVYVDECHTSTEDNTWGENINYLVAKGARVVLMTATALRADNQKIVGFEYDSIDHKDVHLIRGTRLDKYKVKINIFSGSEQVWRIRAHYEKSFSEAWNEQPLPLCKITKQMFDVELDEFKNHELTGGRRYLSEFTENQIKTISLSRICEHPIVINEGAKRLVFELKTQQTETPEIQAVVYCSNDRASDKEVNKHAKHIKKAIHKYGPELKVVIVTSADKEDGRRVLADFIDRRIGDVLIVKQMAGIGLDCSRLKIALDLSPVRTPASYTQRIMRIATPHEDKCSGRTIYYGLLIAPDEITGQAMFQYCVTGQGGEKTKTELALVDSYVVEKPQEEMDKREYLPINTLDSKFIDTNLLHGEPEMQAQVRAQKAKNPRLAQVMTDPEIAAMIIDIRNQDISGAIDETALCKDYLAQLNDYVSKETALRLVLNKTPYGTKEGKSLYETFVSQVWKDWSMACGQEPIKPTEKGHEKLNQLLQYAIRVFNERLIKKAV